MSESSYFVEGEKRAERVSDLFSSIAHRYDLINDLQSGFLHRYWKLETVRFLKNIPGNRVLDICCGTGDVTELLAARGFSTVGADFNQEMLDVARSRVSDFLSSYPQDEAPEYFRADALNLPFEDNSFGGATMCYGLRNLASFENGISEMVRVLKPGGKIAILDFGKPENPLWAQIYFKYLSLSVPLMGQIFAGDKKAYAYIIESLHKYPAKEFIASLLEKAGATQISVKSFLGGVMTLHTASIK